MARRLSDETKKKRKMGTGEGKDYIPYITTSEFNSRGTTSVIKDWKTGRGVHCLSQGETLWYYILRWDDNNVDIREQYPLDVDKTVAIAEEMGIQYPRNKAQVMNKVLAHNIRLVTEFYDSSYVFDWYSAFKHKIAIKELKIDIEHAELTADMARQIIRY